MQLSKIRDRISKQESDFVHFLTEESNFWLSSERRKREMSLLITILLFACALLITIVYVCRRFGRWSGRAIVACFFRLLKVAGGSTLVNDRLTG